MKEKIYSGIFMKLYLLLALLSPVCIATVLQLDRSLDDGIGMEDVEDGVELMRAMGVPDCSSPASFSSWSFPTSIVVKGSSYTVRQTSGLGEYQLLSPSNVNCVVQEGRVVRMDNPRLCRQACFARMANPTLGAEAIASVTSISHPLADTDALYLSRSNGVARTRNALVYKNISITVKSSTPTNVVDFIVTLLNAGLPASERITTPSVQ